MHNFTSFSELSTQPPLRTLTSEERDYYFLPDDVATYREELARIGLADIWPYIDSIITQTQILDSEGFQTGVDMIRQAVVGLQDEYHGDILAVHDGIGKSGEAFYYEYLRDLIPSVIDVSSKSSLFDAHIRLDFNPNLALFVADDSVLTGNHIHALLDYLKWIEFDGELRARTSWGVKRNVFVATLLCSTNIITGKFSTLPKVYGAKSYAPYKVLSLSDLLNKKAIRLLNEKFNYGDGITCENDSPVIIDSQDPVWRWTKIPDTFPEFLTSEGIRNATNNLIDSELAPLDMDRFQPHYKDPDYVLRRGIKG